MKIAENINNYLKTNNLPISEFAKKINLPISTLHGWLNGVPPKNIPDIKKVANHLGVSIDELCFNEDIDFCKKTNIKIAIEGQEFELILKSIKKK